MSATLVRAQVLHTPRDPFADATALEAFSDGAVAFEDGAILATGDYERVRAAHPRAEVVDARDAILLPGLVDTHVHYPQLPIIGAMGPGLLDWLQTRALPEEARLADVDYARAAANVFVHALAANSGIFPMVRHRARGVRIALGTDVGAGTGLSLFKEGLAAYQMQVVQPGGEPLSPVHLLHLATKAGADALGLGDLVGDLRPGKRADLVLVRAPKGGTLAHVLAHSPSPEATLGAIFTLAREECVCEVRVDGDVVFRRAIGNSADVSAASRI